MLPAGSALKIAYGNSQSGQLSFPGLIHRAGATERLRPLGELRQELTAALSAPLEFPAVEQAIVPGDRVVLVADASVPRLADLLQEVVHYFTSHGVQLDQLSIVLPGHAQIDASQLTMGLPGEIQVEIHDPDDQAKVAYVAATKEGEPIYMNRTLVDADVVIPILCARGCQTIDYEGAYGVFPQLTDRRTHGQFYSMRHLVNPGEHRRLTAWADEAAWWVGLLVGVQVIPAPGGGIARIMAGNPQALEQAVQQSMVELWQTQIDGTYDCVLLLIDGDQNQQSWDSVARALASVRPAVAPDGAVVICSELRQRPGRALKRLSSPHRSEEQLAQQLSHDSADDALAAAVLLDGLESCHIYLLSQLPGETVEALGVGALAELHQVEHLLQQHKRCLVVQSAQHAILQAQ